ncbi:MAG: serine/threonine-protein kinase [Phycisphaerales bacterium]|jgi:serine/threonine-protein kinase|nr:serine/threonine-protein kinase [Phycisphaerales bacterium]
MSTNRSQPRKIGTYNILARIGEGAASVLYAVQHPKTKQVSALKHVEKTDEKSQRFLDQVEQEYAIGSKLDHTSIRKVTKLIKHRKMFKVTAMSMIMEHIDATTLDQQLPRNHSKAVDIFRQVAEGLAHMHEKGFVHADIKPNNVLINENNSVKIIDLGQACAIGTTKKRIQGTPGYMAPEQAHRGEVTPQTDIYNLGAMMYWVLVGEVIPTALPPKSARDGLLTGAVDTKDIDLPTPPRGKNPRIHPLLSKQIMACIQPLPKNRPESMKYVANRLELILDVINEPISQTPPVDASGTTVCEE